MDQEKYEVEAILDEQGRGSNKQFLVKWKNYPEEDNSWETMENLQGCKKLLSAFKKNRDTEKARERARVREGRLQDRADRANARRAEARAQEEARQAEALVQKRAHQIGDQVQEEDSRDEGQAQEEAHLAVGQEQEETRRLFASHAAAYRKAAAADAVRRDEAEASRRQHEIDARRFENAMIKLGMPAPRAEDEAAHSIGVLLNGEVDAPVRRVIGHKKKADGTLIFAVELENKREVGILQEHIFQLCGQMAIDYLASEVVTGML